MLERWQQRWNNYDGWAKKFIRDVKKWMEKGPSTNYYATQAITGHGIFGKYLFKIKKAPTDRCWFDCGTPDSPAHTIFECARFTEDRRAVATKVGQQLTQENIAELLVGTKKDGESVIRFLSDVMRKKEKEERRRGQEEN